METSNSICCNIPLIVEFIRTSSDCPSFTRPDSSNNLVVGRFGWLFVPCWVIETHKVLVNVVGEHLAPQHGLLLTRMLHLPYQCPKRRSFQSQTDPVAVAQQYGSGRALRQFQSKGSEIVQKGMNIVVESKASSAIM